MASKKKATKKSSVKKQAPKTVKQVKKVRKLKKSGATGARKKSKSTAAAPTTVGVGPAVEIYALALQKYGLLEGKTGSQKLNEDAQLLLKALHKVLAGGSLQSAPQVTSGSTAVLKNLDDSLSRAMAEANEINGKLGPGGWLMWL